MSIYICVEVVLINVLASHLAPPNKNSWLRPYTPQYFHLFRGIQTWKSNNIMYNFSTILHSYMLKLQKLKMNTMSFKTILMTSLPKDVSLYLIIAISFILFKKRGQFGIYKRHCVQPLNHCIAI